MIRSYYVIDVFTAEAFGGNPAAVLLDAEGLNEASMQAIATEFNLSETTFVLPCERQDAPSHAAHRVRFRWFTPGCEVSMCGHATIAGVQALVESGRVAHTNPMQSTVVEIETCSGRLTAFVENMPHDPGKRMTWLELRPPRLNRADTNLRELAGLLRLSPEAMDDEWPAVRSQDDDEIVFVRGVAALNDARPDFDALADWQTRHGLRGLLVSTVHTLTPSINVQSRFFAPASGVNEDPVTGSVHGPLGAYLVQRGLMPLHDGVAGLTCVQGLPGGRTGVVYVLVHPDEDGSHAVRIGGQVVTVMEGRLVV